MNNNLMIYGANGYSAKLIIKEALSYGIRPVLAGRNFSEVKKISEIFNLPYKIFGLDDDSTVDENISDIHTILNCAGPFKHTAKELIEGCLRNKVNYIDITGEMPVFHLAYSKDSEAKSAGITILPGAGFDIIPTDCLAKRLAELLPDAYDLKLGFLNDGGKISRGTLLTSLDFIGGSGKIRRNVKVIDSPIGEYKVEVDLPNFKMYGFSIPWGDVLTSYFSTKIENSEVYLGTKYKILANTIVLKLSAKIMGLRFVKTIAQRYIASRITGPTTDERNRAKTFLWGKVTNKKGECVEQVYSIMEGYNLTAKGAILCAKEILNGKTKSGSFTPSNLFGHEFLDNFILERVF
jgi:short subunit dehydrogenase-like uncharacterized protein